MDKATVTQEGPYKGLEAEVVDSEQLGGGTRYIVRTESGSLEPRESVSESDTVIREEQIPEGTRYVVKLTDPNTGNEIHAGFMDNELEAV